MEVEEGDGRKSYGWKGILVVSKLNMKEHVWMDGYFVFMVERG